MKGGATQERNTPARSQIRDSDEPMQVIDVDASSTGSKMPATNDPKCATLPGPSVGVPGKDMLSFGDGVVNGHFQWSHRKNIWVRLANGGAEKLQVMGCPAGWFPMPQLLSSTGRIVVSSLWKRAFAAALRDGILIQSIGKPYVDGAAAPTGKKYAKGANGQRTLVSTAPKQIITAGGKVVRKPSTPSLIAGKDEYANELFKDKNGVYSRRRVLKQQYRGTAGRKLLREERRERDLASACGVGKRSYKLSDGDISRCSHKPQALLDGALYAQLTPDQIRDLKKEAAANKKAYKCNQAKQAKEFQAWKDSRANPSAC